MAQWEKLTYAQKTCVRSAGKLMQQTEMLFAGARIGVAVSGGMDSFTLLKVLMLRQRIVPFPIELMVLHVNPGFEPGSHAPLSAWVRENGLASHIETSDHGPRAHSPENKKRSACFYCCRLRRKRLFELMKQYKLTHLALGHNADDLAATFFLNLFNAGRVEGMSISEPFFGGEFTLIRPLLWVEKSVIRRACAKWELPIWKNACPSSETTQRTVTMQWLKDECAGDKRKYNNIMNGLRRFQLAKNMPEAQDEE